MERKNKRRELYRFSMGIYIGLALLWTLPITVAAVVRAWWLVTEQPFGDEAFFVVPVAVISWIVVCWLIKARSSGYPENHRYFTIKVSGRHRFDYEDIPDGPYTLAQLETNVGMVNFIESIMMSQSVVLGDTPENMKVIKDRFAKDFPSNRIRSKISGTTAIDQVTLPVEAWKLMTKPQRDAILKIAAYVNLRRETRTEQYMPPIYRALGV